MRSEVASTAGSPAACRRSVAVHHGKISSMDQPRHVAELAVVDVTAEIRKVASGPKSHSKNSPSPGGGSFGEYFAIHSSSVSSSGTTR